MSERANERALRSTRVLAGALLLGLSLATLARAEDAPGQERPPQPEPGTTAQSACIKQETGWLRDGRNIFMAIALTNRCEARITCRVFAYVTSAKGAAQGHGRLALAPASKGKAATKQWKLRVPMSGGSAQTTRECKAG
jgi:hypothetical protein